MTREASEVSLDRANLVDEAGAGWLLKCGRKRAIFGTIGAADRGDPAQMIFSLVAIALLDLPEAVIVPCQDMIRIGLQRALIPDLRELVVAQLAIGIANEVRHVRVVIVAERPELNNGRGIVMPIIDRVISRAVSLPEGGIIKERLLVVL